MSQLTEKIVVLGKAFLFQSVRVSEFFVGKPKFGAVVAVLVVVLVGVVVGGGGVLWSSFFAEEALQILTQADIATYKLHDVDLVERIYLCMKNTFLYFFS